MRSEKETLERLARKAWPAAEHVDVNALLGRVYALEDPGNDLVLSINHQRAKLALVAALRVLAGEAEPSVPVSELRLFAAQIRPVDGNLPWQERDYACDEIADSLIELIAKHGG